MRHQISPGGRQQCQVEVDKDLLYHYLIKYWLNELFRFILKERNMLDDSSYCHNKYGAKIHVIFITVEESIQKLYTNIFTVFCKLLHWYQNRLFPKLCLIHLLPVTDLKN